MADSFDMIAKTFFGLEEVLAEELRSLGADDVQTGRRMVAFRGDERLLVRANIHCRSAVRVLKPIATFAADKEQALYRGMSEIDWATHLEPTGSLAIDPVVHSPIFSNSLYAAQLAKDAIVDQLRDSSGRRPTVDLADPDLRINLHISQDRVTVYLDSSGDSLHKRGYRVATGEAPINEVLAAGILRLTGWDERSPLVDFMCGSGTFVIEGALMARRIAPGLLRAKFGYQRWKGFDARLHTAAVEEARRDVLPRLSFPIQGTDLDQAVIAAARENADRAGVAADVTLAVDNFASARPAAPSGTLITNPPYDERMKISQIALVYRRLGDALKQHWAGYTAFVFTGNLEAGKQIGLRPTARVRLFNGPIECRLLKFPMVAASDEGLPKATSSTAADHAGAFRNRLTRMARHWHRWARRQNITAYRIYDRDVAEVPLAIDWFAGRVRVTEHARPHGRTEIEHVEWLDALLEIIGGVLDVPLEAITVDRKNSPKPTGKLKEKYRPKVVQVQERDLQFEVHLAPRQDPGLDPDRRILRSMLAADAPGKRFLSLFGRTGSASVAAAAGGALSSLTVEASRTFVDWAKINFQLNGVLTAEHRLLCQDPLQFVHHLDAQSGARFDLACVEPPSFDGKRRPGIWNVQDGHVELLNNLLECLSPGGKIFFISTFRRLKLHVEQIRGATVREITRQTVPPDFRNKKVHRAWVLLRTSESDDE